MTEASSDLSSLELAFLIASAVFWVWLIARGYYRPLGISLIIAMWHAIVDPAAMSVGLAASRRRSKLVSRFLQDADDLRMRDQPVDQIIPRLPRGGGGAGEGGIAG